MTRLLKKCLQRTTDAGAWKEARRRSAAAAHPGLILPHRKPVALLVVGLEHRPLQTAVQLCGDVLRRSGGAERLDMFENTESAAGSPVDALVAAVRRSSNLVVTVELAAAGVVSAMLDLLTDSGYRTAALLVLPRRPFPPDSPRAAAADEIDRACSELQSRCATAWLVPGRPRATRRANESDRTASERHFELPGEVPAASSSAPSEAMPVDPLVSMRWECLNILRRRAEQES